MDDYKPISQKELERGYFFVTHRLLLQKIILAIVILLLAILYVFAVWRGIAYFRGGSFGSLAAQIDEDTFDWASYHQKRAPQEIVIDDAQSISLGNKKYNLTAQVANPNNDWALSEVEYYFVVNGQATPTATTWLNPGEEKLFLLPAYEAPAGVTRLSLEISDKKWQRIDSNFINIDFEVANVQFHAATRQVVDNQTLELSARVSWQATNTSLLSFWDVGWQVALYNGDRLVAINQLTTHDFLGLEQRDLEVAWLNQLPRVTKAKVIPLFNKLDYDNIKDVEVEPRDYR